MRVAQLLILVPVLVQVGLTFCLWALFWYREFVSRRSERVADCYRSMFELPVLFYAAALFGYTMRVVDERLLFAAVAFVVFQIVQTVIGLRSGHGLGHQISSVGSGLAVALMWLIVGGHLAVSGL